MNEKTSYRKNRRKKDVPSKDILLVLPSLSLWPAVTPLLPPPLDKDDTRDFGDATTTNECTSRGPRLTGSDAYNGVETSTRSFSACFHELSCILYDY